MKKVYIVIHDMGYDGLLIEGIYSTHKKAENHILQKYRDCPYDLISSSYETDWGDVYILEWEIDTMNKKIVS